MAEVNVQKEIRWALMALGFVRNTLVAMGIKAEEENGTALINLDAAIATLQPIAGAPVNESGKRSTSAATASGHELPDSTSTPEKTEAAGPGQERHQAQDQHTAGSQERCGEVANGGDARVASAGCARPHDEAAPEPADAPQGGFALALSMLVAAALSALVTTMILSEGAWIISKYEWACTESTVNFNKPEITDTCTEMHRIRRVK